MRYPRSSIRLALWILPALVLLLLDSNGVAAKPPVLQSEHVVLENARVRVIEYRSQPNGGVCGVGEHKHPAHVTIVLAAAKDRATTAGAKAEVGDMKVGDVYWSDGDDHTDVNTGKTESRLIVVELK
ncbi:MAG: hypothetical protein ACRENN_08550 [Candidatus Eiseniibacteriota bacterium]